MGFKALTVLAAAGALTAALLHSVAPGPPVDTDPAQSTSRSVPTITFDAGQSAETIRASLRCNDRLSAVAALPARSATVTRPLSLSASTSCQIHLDTTAMDAHVDEVEIVVSSAGEVLERHLAHATSGEVVSKPFDRGTQDLQVQIAAERLPADEVGTGLRVMTFNVYLGGQLNDDAEPGWAQQNLDQLAEFVRAEDPDVLFMIETYGAGEVIEEALNADQPQDRQFTGVQITRPEDLGANGDNLWLFTALDVEEIYPPVSTGSVSTFHFGGARLGLPDGGHLHAFSSWLHHQESARVAANRAAMENVFGLCRTDTDEEVIGVDEYARLAMAQSILNDYLPAQVTDDAPVLIGGDFNTLSHLDWSEQHAHAPGHEGMSFDWPVTAAFEDAGFIDTFRHVHPDVSRYPGRTMDTIHGHLYAPDRIDYLLARGQDVRILGSRTHTERLPEHREGALADHYPFYSDHAAVVSDLVLRGAGPGLGRGVVTEPDRSEQAWPDPPAGHQVPPHALSATASSAQESRPASRAVDGDPRTHWATEEDADAPHLLTVDLGQRRELSAVRYIPRIDSNYGMALRGVLQASDDGETFTDVAELHTDRYNRPTDFDLEGVRAQYLRLQIDHHVVPMAAAAQLIPYQRTPPTDEAPPEQVREVIVAPGINHSDCSPAYHETGPWISSNLPGHDGSPSRYSNEPGATAHWIPELSANGTYEVAIWWPEHDTATDEATYTISSAEGTAQVSIDPLEHAGSWHPLGTWDFTAGTAGEVVLTVGSGYHRAAAIQFQPVGQGSQ